MNKVFTLKSPLSASVRKRQSSWPLCKYACIMEGTSGYWTMDNVTRRLRCTLHVHSAQCAGYMGPWEMLHLLGMNIEHGGCEAG